MKKTKKQEHNKKKEGKKIIDLFKITKSPKKEV